MGKEAPQTLILFVTSKRNIYHFLHSVCNFLRRHQGFFTPWKKFSPHFSLLKVRVPPLFQWKPIRRKLSKGHPVSLSLGSCLKNDFFSRPLRPKMQESIHLHQKLKFNLRIYLYSLFVLQFFFLSMQYLGWWEIKLDSLKQSVEMVLFVALHVKLANQEVG